MVDESGDRLRLIGVNAPDEGECLHTEASVRLAELLTLPHTVDDDVETRDRFGRRLVYVTVTERETSILVNEAMVAEGLAFPIHAGDDRRHEERLFAARDTARTEGTGFWDPSACGNGALVVLEITAVSHDPPGPDTEDLDGEYVTIGNPGPVTVGLGGWSVRDESTANRFHFPGDAELAAGAEVTVTSGAGAFGFGLETPVWNNDGDTVMVLDPSGRVSALADVAG